MTGRGAIVLDPFAGTGTTIIAAEKTGRHGRAIERDPLYCDVIIRRWQQYTGKAARLAGSDLTFADVEAEPPYWAKRVRRLELRGSVTCPKNPIPHDGEPLESQADGSQSKPAEEYKVGPGSPPPDKRWKKGGPSPNPRGRPRKEQSMLPDVRKAFEQAINKKVSVPRGDKTVLMTRIEIGLEQLLNQFAKGDRHARRDLMEYADKLGIDFLAKHKQTLEQALTPNYQAILDAYVARRRRRKRCAGDACGGFVGTSR